MPARIQSISLTNPKYPKRNDQFFLTTNFHTHHGTFTIMPSFDQQYGSGSNRTTDL